jgi:cellulose synthase/poly-beta-1,6-N-acetylglucosamine synthase-like glycosyltransferase
MDVIGQILIAILLVVVLLQVALVGYLLFLSLAALLMRPGGRRDERASVQRRFAILVPAHNEQVVIGRLLASLSALEYPKDRFEVCVVADNCDDATAMLARSAGARVYERFSSDERAKGYALRWLLQQLQAEGRSYDAFVIVDADSVLASNFLRVMDARLARGARVVQAYYSVLNAEQSAVASLRYAALAAVHYLRPLGRSAFGWSCGLKGNGMCFESDVFREFTWRWFTLAEDVEFHLALIQRGVAVEFAPETWVKADMPVSLQQSASQNSRWERGRLQMIRQHVPRLVLGGLRRRNWLEIDAAVEQMIPPLSVPFALGVISVPAAMLSDAPVLAGVALACLVGYALYLVVALALVGAPLRVYVALGMAPLYIAWKVGLYARSLVSGRSGAWVRTARA